MTDTITRVVPAASELILRDHLLSAVRRHRDRRAIVADGRDWAYAELDDSARRLAAYLFSRGVGPRDHVAIVLRNSVEYAVADLAIAVLGAAKVPVNLMLSDDEIAFILEDSRAKVCIVDARRIAAAMSAVQSGASCELLAVAGDGQDAWSEALAFAPLSDLPVCSGDDPALIMYTGGTTGRPKGVVHTQHGVVMNLLSHLIEMELVAEDILLLTSPLPHSGGFLLQAGLTKGATAYLEDGFSIDRVLERIESDRVTYLFMVPTMIYRLLDAVAARPAFDCGSVRTILYGAAPIAVDRLEQGLRLFGSVFMQLFAQSEAPNFLTRLRRDDHRTGEYAHRLESVGQSVVMAQVRTVGENGDDCATGEVGEVVARAPYTMLEYLGNPDATQATLRAGWLYTGDLGYFDGDGYLYLVDRKKDMIITGGLNVYSIEVEQKIAAIPGVKDVAVVGIPHPDWGEAIVAFVVVDDATTTVEQIHAASRDALSAYKRPKAVVPVAELPTTAVGKIDKKRLRSDWTGW